MALRLPQGASTAASLPFTPTGDIQALTVQEALRELDLEKAPRGAETQPPADIDGGTF